MLDQSALAWNSLMVLRDYAIFVKREQRTAQFSNNINKIFAGKM
jgi:hypothetical protein